MLSGGPYTTASKVRQCQEVCPPPPWPSRRRDDEDLVGAERMPVGAAARRLGDPRAGGGSDKLALVHLHQATWYCGADKRGWLK